MTSTESRTATTGDQILENDEVSEEVGPEQQRLKSRLFDNPTRKLVNFHITRGEKPATAEQICGEVNKAMDEIAAFHALPVEEQMRREIKQVYERLSRAIEFCKFDAREIGKPVTDARKRLGDIFCELDMSLVTLGNWIDNHERWKIKAAARETLSKDSQFT